MKILALIALLSLTACDHIKTATSPIKVDAPEVIASLQDTSKLLKLDLKLEADGKFTGLVTNISGKYQAFIMLRTEFYDADGASVGQLVDTANNLAAGAVWKLQHQGQGTKTFKVKTVLVQE